MSHRNAQTLCIALFFALCACTAGSGGAGPAPPESGETTVPEETTVPDVQPNDWLTDARRLIKNAGLQLDSVNVDPLSVGLGLDAPYRVISVDPAPGSVVETGSTVHVQMAYRPTDECPDIVLCYPVEASNP